MTFTEEQLQAIHCTDDKIVLLAGAGSGKSATLLERIQNSVKHGVDSKSILALTFTRVAAQHMEQKYMDSADSDTPATIPTFSTFHGFCYQLLQLDNELLLNLGYTTVPVILTDEDYDSVVEIIKKRYSIKLTDNVITGKRKPKTIDEKFQFTVFQKSIKRYLKENNMITFDLLSQQVCNLFCDNHPCVQKYKEQFKYIYVDEFQDTDSTQWEFVKSFDNANIFVCGDIKQAIYGFRNADSSIMKSLIADYTWTKLKLTKNFRSTIEICEFANQIHPAHSEYDIIMDSTVHGNHVVELESFKYTINDLEYIIQTVDTNKSTAILCRTNFEIDKLSTLLINILSSRYKHLYDSYITGELNLHIGTIHSVKGLEFDSVHVINPNGKYFKLGTEEDYNLYYVACTRTKESLYIWK